MDWGQMQAVLLMGGQWEGYGEGLQELPFMGISRERRANAKILGPKAAWCG